MVALCNRADHYIFALWFLSIFFFNLFFIPRLISVAADWMSTIMPQDAKMMQKIAICAPSHNFVGLYCRN